MWLGPHSGAHEAHPLAAEHGVLQLVDVAHLPQQLGHLAADVGGLGARAAWHPLEGGGDGVLGDRTDRNVCPGRPPSVPLPDLVVRKADHPQRPMPMKCIEECYGNCPATLGVSDNLTLISGKRATFSEPGAAGRRWPGWQRGVRGVKARRRLIRL